MAKVSHSSDLIKCRQCGAGLDVYVEPEVRFCSEECCVAQFREARSSDVDRIPATSVAHSK